MNIVIKTMQPVSFFVDRLHNYISKNDNEDIVLLRNKNVIQWIYNDLTFLETEQKVTAKIAENQWGKSMMKIKRPDMNINKQWTNRFGEYLCQELYEVFEYDITVPTKKKHFKPDLEIEDAIIEVKTGTYFTTGTAHEKILGCPFKYCEIPELYKKPLRIVCIGGAEKICRTQYGNIGQNCCETKKKYIRFFHENGIDFVALSDLINDLLIETL